MIQVLALVCVYENFKYSFDVLACIIRRREEESGNSRSEEEALG
jgi:hypothetical protein